MSDFDPKRARAKRPCPLWVDAFQRDTQHLNADEVGAYMLILMAMWTRPTCDLPNDPARIARVARVSKRLWDSRIGPVIMDFLVVDNGAVVSERLRKEAAYVERQVKQQSDRKSGKKPDKSLKNMGGGQSVDDTTDKPRNHPSQLPNNPTVKKEEPKGSLSPIDDIQLAFDAYNVAAKEAGWPVAKVLNKPRRSGLTSRLKDAGGLQGWIVALEKAKSSPLCTGDNNRGWVADLDFLLQQKSFTRLMEGSYDNRTHQPRTTPQRHQDGPDAALANIARVAGLGAP